MSRKQRIALKELRDMEGVAILPVDKGNATVVMEREEYDMKIEWLLGTSTYRQLKKDPTATQKARIGRILRSFVRKKEISDTIYNRLIDQQGANHQESTDFLKSTKTESHSGPSSRASTLQPTSWPNILPDS